jgi:hypothetical protein
VGAPTPGAAGPPGQADEIDWSRASLDSAAVPAPREGERTGPNPTDRSKRGSKRHLLVDRNGIPLAVKQSAANVHDSKMLEQAVDAIRPIHRPRGRPGRPRKRSEKLHAYSRATTPTAAARPCASEGSRRASPGAARTRASGWGGTGGSWSGPCRG